MNAALTETFRAAINATKEARSAHTDFGDGELSAAYEEGGKRYEEARFREEWLLMQLHQAEAAQKVAREAVEQALFADYWRENFAV